MKHDRYALLAELVLAAALLAACAGVPASPGAQAPEPSPAASPTPAPATGEPTAALPEPAPATGEPAAAPPEPAPTLDLAALPPFDGQPLPADRGDLFNAAGNCAICHTNMADQSGADVSVDTFWRATMMANAARDPYWQATVRSEVAANPALQAAIEDKCATCHMPMARFTANAAGDAVAVLDGGFLDPAHPLHTLAMDGVSCTVCHQIEPDGFGQPEGFSGHYAIDAGLPTGERLTYGPFPAPPNLATVMQGGSGFIPTQSTHLQQSEMCATCHTLYTPYVDASGEVAGEFPEQTPYLEWLASSYADTQSCQACHMPQAEGGVQLSITGGPLRQPFHQHAFAGGSTTMLAILRAQGEALGLTAASADLDAAIARMAAQMQTQAATVAVEDAALAGGDLSFEVAVTSLTGHKFPAGFPSRRAWLHVTVTDAAGGVVFESGAFRADGSIDGNDNDADPAAYEPHYAAISQPGEVQIYEPIMGNTEGEVTTTLLRGASYLKDNRLLPDGFDKAGAGADVAVTGNAADDADFTGGGDRVRYTADTGEASGPFTVTVELLYQSIGYRWAENLRSVEGPEADTFFATYDAIPNLPVTVATAAVEVGL